jgi:hypothetical protein
VVVNLQGLREDATKVLQPEMDEAVHIAQEGLRMVLSALAKRKGK